LDPSRTRERSGRTATRGRFAFRRVAICRLWYDEPDAISNAIGHAKFRSRSHNAVIRVYDEAAT
jgi:hypothetical protein